MPGRLIQFLLADWSAEISCSHVTNRRRVSDNNNISQLLRGSFSVSQQPPICEPPSHYSMPTTLSRLLLCNISPSAFLLCVATADRPLARRSKHLQPLRLNIRFPELRKTVCNPSWYWARVMTAAHQASSTTP